MNKTQKKWILGVFCGAVLLFVAVFALMQWQKTKQQDTGPDGEKKCTGYCYGSTYRHTGSSCWKNAEQPERLLCITEDGGKAAFCHYDQ